MSVAGPATPRRSVLHAHPQGLSTTMPSIAEFASQYNKSPLTQRQLHLHQSASARAESSTRSQLQHKQSHPPLATPMAFPGLNILDQTATAPARLPVPMPAFSVSSSTIAKPRSKSKRMHSDNEDNDDGYPDTLNRLREAIGGQPPNPSNAKRVRRSPPPTHQVPSGDRVIYLDDDEGDNYYPTHVPKPALIAPRTASLKRPRAPASPLRAPTASQSQHQPGTAERVTKKAKIVERRADREERERLEARFRDKYTRAFPSFKFYFDSIDPSVRNSLAFRASQLGARVEDFFSASVTHFITNKPVPTLEDIAALENKENAPNSNNPNNNNLAPPNNGRAGSAAPQLRSPIKLKPPVNKYDVLVTKAVHFKQKVWDEKKLDSILGRLLLNGVTHKNPAVASAPHHHDKPSQTLSYLLENERHSGVTYERDPTAQRQDYRYFPKNTYWLLIEDIDGDHAPIAVKDYGRYKPRTASAAAVVAGKKSNLRIAAGRKRKGDALFMDYENGEEDGDDSPPWPPLRDVKGKAKPDWAYGKVSELIVDEPEDLEDPGELESRQSLPVGDEVEIRQISDDDEDEDAIQINAIEGATGDVIADDGSVTDDDEEKVRTSTPLDPQTLRRTASMHDMGRAISIQPHPHANVKHAAHSRRQITQHRPIYNPHLRDSDRDYIAASGNSVTITSHVNSTTSYAYGPGGEAMTLGPGTRQLERRLHHQVVTRAATGTSNSVATGASARPQHMVKKAKSTNMLRKSGGVGGGKTRLPTREEAKKPGYCENCRCKFEDFSKHATSKRHRRYAENDSNFSALDDIIRRLTASDPGENDAEGSEEELEQDEDEDDELEIVGHPGSLTARLLEAREQMGSKIRAPQFDADEDGDEVQTVVRSVHARSRSQSQSHAPSTFVGTGSFMLDQDLDGDDPFVAH